MKCIVKNCDNRMSEGKFVGMMCSPCHQFVSEGIGRYSQAYRNALEVGISAVLASMAESAANLADPTHTVGFRVEPR